jgi:hypothetical protein
VYPGIQLSVSAQRLAEPVIRTFEFEMVSLLIPFVNYRRNRNKLDVY